MEPKLNESTRRLGEAPLVNLILSLSVPGMVAMLTITLYQLADTFWVAKLGHEAIAAITVVMPIQVIVIAVALGSAIGISSLTSRRFGEGDVETTNHIAGHVFAVALFPGSIFTFLFVAFAPSILTIGGATPDIMDYATQYLTIVAFGAPFLVFSMVTNDLLRGSGDALRPMIFSITGSVTNIILDPFMIFGIGAFPEMGIRGAALATVISQFFAATLAFGHIVVLRRSAFRINLRHLKPSLAILRDIYSVGFPTMIIELTQSFAYILFNKILSGFGSMALAAGGLAIRIIDLACMPIFGASEGVLPIVGFNYGARLWRRLWGTVRLASLGLGIGLGIFTIIAIIFSPQLIAIFTDEVKLMEQGIMAVRITISTVCIFGPSHMFLTTLMGMGKGRDVLFLSLTRQFFFLVSLFILPRFFGITGVWGSIPVMDLAGFSLYGFWLLRVYRRERALPGWVDQSLRIKSELTQGRKDSKTQRDQ